MPLPSPVICLRKPISITARTWGDECVIFLGDSRETHLLSPPCAYILDLLANEPVSYDILSTKLHEFFDDAESGRVGELLDQIIATLRKIGIVESTGGRF